MVLTVYLSMASYTNGIIYVMHTIESVGYLLQPLDIDDTIHFISAFNWPELLFQAGKAPAFFTMLA